MLLDIVMMASGGWDGQDHHMTGAPDDDFQHFLDISSMGDELQFDFNGFQDGATQVMLNRQREEAQALINDANNNPLMGQAAGMMQGQASHMNAGAGAAPGQMMPTSAPGSDSITNIDAQIQYLQQQKFQQQQRQLQEQRNAFFQSHHHTRSIPPTPQSLEMPPGSGQFYTQTDQMTRDVFDRTYNHQRMKEHQDVSSPRSRNMAPFPEIEF